MILLENKLDIFKRLVFDDEQKKIEEELLALQEQNEAMRQEKLELFEAKKEDILSRKIHRTKAETKELMFQTKREAKEMEQKKHKELFLRLKKNIQEELVRFSEQPEYREKMKAELHHALAICGEKEVLLSVLEKDAQWTEKFIKDSNTAVKVQYRVLSNDRIGGFVLSDQNQNYRMDYTLKNRLDQSGYEIGRELTRELEMRHE